MWMAPSRCAPPASGVIDALKPVVGDHFAAGVEDESAEGVALVGVGVDAPVGAVEVFVDGADGRCGGKSRHQP